MKAHVLRWRTVWLLLLMVWLLAAGWPAVNSSLPGSSGQILYNNGGVPGAKTLQCADLSDAGSGCSGSLGGAGTVTSVATGFGLTGGPITSSGTVSMVAPGGDDQVYVSSSTSTAAWKTLPNCSASDQGVTYATASNAWGCNTFGAALTKTDDTNVTLTLGGSDSTALVHAASLTLGWTGQLGVSRGGTGADLSSTGGTSRVLKQTSTGAAVTVARLSCSDLSDSGSGCTDSVAGTTAAGIRTFGAFFDGAGAALVTGTSLPFQVPYPCTISGYSISVSTADTATFKVWKTATGTAIPTASDVINTAGVSIASGTHMRSTTTSDFTTTTVTAHDVVIIQLSSVGGTTQGATLQVECTL